MSDSTALQPIDRLIALHERDAPEIPRPGRVVRPFVGADKGAERLSAGVVTFPSASESIPHVHEVEEEVLYVVSGRGALFCDGRRITLEPGSFVFVPPGVEHSVHVDEAEPLKFFYVFSPTVVIGTW
jgi:quercetin dioxygenase-like cupin family protein